MLDWHVAIYCSNEQDRIAACIASVANALAGRDALITVLLNGSSDDSLARARDAISRQTGAQGEIVRIAHGDKSNAINQFLHTLRQPAQAYGAVDGYATVGARSFQAMAARLSRDSAALAVSGVAISGRSMAR